MRTDLPRVTPAEVRALRRAGLLRRTLRMYRELGIPAGNVATQHRMHIDGARSQRKLDDPGPPRTQDS